MHHFHSELWAMAFALKHLSHLKRSHFLEFLLWISHKVLPTQCSFILCPKSNLEVFSYFGDFVLPSGFIPLPEWLLLNNFPAVPVLPQKSNILLRSRIGFFSRIPRTRLILIFLDRNSNLAHEHLWPSECQRRAPSLSDSSLITRGSFPSSHFSACLKKG